MPITTPDLQLNTRESLGERLTRKIFNLYLYRFPLLIGAFLFFLPFSALGWFPSISTRPLLGAIFEMNAVSAFWAALIAFVISWSIFVIYHVISRYGTLRCGISNINIKNSSIIRQSFLFVLIAAPISIGLVTQPEANFKHYVAIICAFFASSLLMLSFFLIQALLMRPSQNHYLSFGHSILGFRKIFHWAKNTSSPIKSNQKAHRLLSKIPQYIGEGYIVYPSTINLLKENKFFGNQSSQNEHASVFPIEEGQILPGHGLWVFMLVSSIIVYIIMGLVNQSSALAYILMLLLIICWILASLSFFLDRYRVPVIAILGIYLFLVAQVSDSDYYYRVVPDHGSNPKPQEVLAAANARKQTPIIVVAASSGGIHAASWMTRILTGLEEKCRKDPELKAADKHFARSIRFISGVSGGAVGGAVGALFFVSNYDKTTGDLPSNPAAIRRIVDLAEHSSLNASMHGLAYLDLARRMFVPWPFASFNDRGNALEQAWAKEEKFPSSLADWRNNVLQCRQPAILFSALITETGIPLHIGTTTILGDGFEQRSFDHCYPGYNVAPQTAARLSATFPFVTPLARAPYFLKPMAHIIDGSLWDGYGMDTLVTWLNEALKLGPKSVPPILVIQIRDNPFRIDDEFEVAQNVSTNNKWASWLYQFTGPLSAVMGAKETKIHATNHSQFALFRDYWTKVTGNPNTIQTVKFTFHSHQGVTIKENGITRKELQGDEIPPVSWHLTQAQKKMLDEECESQLQNKRNWEKIKQFMLQNN